ncbi:biotin attachment protein [Anaerovorax odorimutans]|uniref:Biotin attachment protein n=1 Tax=Anaerovorax odorimutans TaxID=109327 RepID=A0ABT1RST5_9FIRM|nr:biotin/lipoyl-containing protein [Anaerovorax odorimutans]MCQ4638272.1 biotin attachment protein [Anaerovorax odorimutans]
MENKIQMPKMSPSMEAGVLVAWNKELEEPVREGEVLFEVETDKVVCEIEAPCDGVLAEMCYSEGDRVKVGETVAVIQER